MRRIIAPDTLCEYLQPSENGGEIWVDGSYEYAFYREANTKEHYHTERMNPLMTKKPAASRLDFLQPFGN